ncbi:MAG TPA: hypothetical protein VGN32_06655, partial [Ktedonobacterales bacterium]|nr:hypothetical protein [Ktedonobacterales bacterium]
LALTLLGAVEPVSEPRAQRIARICQTLTTPSTLTRLLGQLDALSLRLLYALVLREGTLLRTELERMRQHLPAGSGSIEQACDALARHGLGFRAGHGGTRGASQQQESWYIPEELLAALDPLLPVRQLGLLATRHAAPAGAPQDPSRRVHTHQTRAASARPLWGLLGLLPLVAHLAPPAARLAGGAPAGPERTPTAAALPLLRGDLPAATLAAWARDTQRPEGLVRLAWRTMRSLDDAQRAGDRGVPLHSVPLHQVPRSEWPFALRAAFRRWLSDSSYGELADLTPLEHGVRARCDPRHPALRSATLAAENTAARRFLVGLVARLPVHVWISTQSLLELVWWAHPYFLRARQRAFARPAWWLEAREHEGVLRPHVRDDWLRADARYALALCAGPLHWWGLLDLDYAAPAELGAVRLTHFGAFMLGGADAVPGEAIQALERSWGPAALPVRPAGLSIQPLAHASALLDALTPWAAIERLAGERLLLRLSRDRVCQSLDQGLTPAAALAQLQLFDARDHSSAAPAIERVLTEWQATYGRTRLSADLVLLEALDEAVLREALSASPAIASSCRIIGPRLALVPAHLASDLAAALDRRGFVV